MGKKIILYILFLILIKSVIGQNSKSKTYWQLNLQYGFVFEQEAFYQMMAPSHIKAISLEYGFLSKGKALWQKVYHFPTFGLGVHYMNLENPNVLGKAYSVFGFFKYPAFKSKPKLLIGNAQFGLAYLTKKFDVESNIWNIAIGTHFNVYGNLSGDGQIKINDRLFWKYGIGLTHYSNGTFATPNLGINVISVRTGFRFNAYKLSPEYSQVEKLPPFTKESEIIVSVWSGIREEYPVDGQKYPSVDLSLNYMYALDYDKKIGFGTDIMYESYIKSKIVRLKYKDYAAAKDLYRLGVYTSYDFVLSRFQLFVHAGSYLYNQLPKPTKYLYERIGLNYSLSKNIKASIMLKLHYAEADYFAIGAAYNFKLK